MSTDDPVLMNLLERKMSYLNQKESVYAENVANASTPGYKAREVSAFTFGDALKQASIGMKVDDPHHIIPASMSGVNASTVKVKTYESFPNGNNVSVEQEALKVSETNVQYQLVTGIYKKFAGLFKLALKGQ